jgi:hypothetical protein
MHSSVGQVHRAVFHALTVAHRELLPWQIQILLAQFFHFALTQNATLQEQ